MLRQMPKHLNCSLQVLVNAISRWTLTNGHSLLAERRKPSGDRPVNAAKPEGSRPAATETQSIWR